MSETDIYKNREAMPFDGTKTPKKKRRRRSSSQNAFDKAHDRKRRSKNSGFRRLLHLSRKSDNEKYFWSSIGIVIVVLLCIIGVWQYVIFENQVRSEEEKDFIQYQPRIPEIEDSAAE